MAKVAGLAEFGESPSAPVPTKSVGAIGRHRGAARDRREIRQVI